jgi:hypothetical protein
MRKPCADCCRKHLASAMVLLDEAHLGYPVHRWIAVGHLQEAESESIGWNYEFAKKIRACRLEVMKSHAASFTHCIEDLLIEACILAGEIEDVQFDPNNSKVFDLAEMMKGTDFSLLGAEND